MTPRYIHKQPVSHLVLKLVIAILIVVFVANLLPGKLADFWMIWSIIGFMSFPIYDSPQLWKHFIRSPIIGIYEVLDRLQQKLSSRNE